MLFGLSAKADILRCHSCISSLLFGGVDCFGLLYRTVDFEGPLFYLVFATFASLSSRACFSEIMRSIISICDADRRGSHVCRAFPLPLLSGTCFSFCSRLPLFGFLLSCSFDDVLLSACCCMILPYLAQLEILIYHSRRGSSQLIFPFSMMCLLQVLETCSRPSWP
jgi:hypothetical protein